MTPDFLRTERPDPHHARARNILARHPEVRSLMGRNPATALIAAILIALQLALAWLISAWQLPWWVALLAAAVVGAHLVHALYAVIHEAAHRLVFAARWANQLLTLACNGPLIAPFAIALSHYHLVHHRTQGQRDRDPDLPAPWERRWFAGSPLRKLMYCAVFPLLQLFRPTQPRDRLSLRNGWLIANIALQLAVSLTVLWRVGPLALLYLLASVYFWSGLHPLFGRFVQEHFVMAEPPCEAQETQAQETQIQKTRPHEDQLHEDQRYKHQPHETHSYDGPLNRITLNIGYHVEHHDLPSIPWNRLPQLTRMAPSFYADRTRHHSWARLWWRFIVDPKISVSSRVARPAHAIQRPAVRPALRGVGSHARR